MLARSPTCLKVDSFFLIISTDVNKCISILLLLLAFPLLGWGQDPHLDRLEMWFDQGNYSKVIRKSKRLIKTKEYQNHALPHLWHALATVAQKQKKGKELYNSLILSSAEFKKFSQLENARHYIETYNNQILDYQEVFLAEVATYKNSQKKRAQELFQLYQTTFETTIAYNDIAEQPLPSPNPPKEEPVPSELLGDAIVATAKNYLGVPYKWGGTNEKGFDCSGYTGFVMSKHGIQLHRKATDQARQIKKTKLSKAAPGDLVFFGSGKKISHVGIVISKPGEDLSMIHASSSKGIMISNIQKSTYWKPRLLYVGKIIVP